MRKITKLRICNWLLATLTLITLASSLQLEALPCRCPFWVWTHIAIASIFMSLIVWHIYLHFGWKSWFSRFRTQKSPVTRWLAIFGTLTLLSAAIALTHWFTDYSHSSIGGVHGKIGFIFIILTIGHTIKRIKFFKSR